jgi:hypothetical protein
MSRPISGEAVPKRQRDERIESSYWNYVHTHPRVAPSDELEQAYTAGWRAGGKEVLRYSAELAGLVPTMRELIAWFDE